MRQCNVPGGQQVPTGRGGCYSLLDGEPWRILFTAEPLGPAPRVWAPRVSVQPRWRGEE